MSIRKMVHSLTNVFLRYEDHDGMRSHSDDLEQTNNPPAVEQNNNNGFPPEHINNNPSAQFPLNIVLAIGMALLSAQLQNKKLPVSCLNILSLLILLSFLCVLVANLIAKTPFVNMARVLEKVAVLLVSMAVVFTIATPLPLPLKCFAWFLYLVSFSSVLFCCFN